MKPPIRTPFTSWDGLEDEELGDIKSAIRDIENAKDDIAKKKDLRRPSKGQEKKLKEATVNLISVTREWARRPRPTMNQQNSIKLNNQERIKLRKLYVLIQDGLQNPVKALDTDFIERLQELCQLTKEIGATGPDEVEEALSESGDSGDHMDVEAGVMSDREILEQEGVFCESACPCSIDTDQHHSKQDCLLPTFRLRSGRRRIGG
jgi:hypothetical protein